MTSETAERNATAGTTIRGLWKTMRPHQWTKNVLIFAPLFFDGKAFNLDALVAGVVGFILLSLTASSIYVINDIVDVESDRQHPKKRNRPIAAGLLPMPVARLAAFLLPAGSLAASLFVSPGFALVLVVYFVLHVAYSFRLKHIVIVDILIIAAGFVLRVVAGATIVELTRFSPWLYVCTITLSLFLAAGKRRQEFLELGENAGDVRRVFKQYTPQLLDEILRLAVTSTFITYVIYTIEAPWVGGEQGENVLMLLTIPFVLYGLLRYLYLIYVEGEGSAPDEILLSDRYMQLAISGWVLVFLILIYLRDSIGMV